MKKDALLVATLIIKFVEKNHDKSSCYGCFITPIVTLLNQARQMQHALLFTLPTERAPRAAQEAPPRADTHPSA
jgi:hypothetical protein